jgi:hypothetical protein
MEFITLMKKYLNKVYQILSYRHFFWFVEAIFILSAVWIALSALYPQAFDESFHFGLIQVYSHYWLPFLARQPQHADAYGAVARDPSYLYHYLMSFPYRIIKLVDPEQIGQIILLRFINIALFASGLYVFRKLLQKIGISTALSNLIFIIFILIPITPQLAAHINYDNLLFPLIALVCLQSFTVIDELLKKQPNIRHLLILVITCLFTSLVKYVFLPIFLGIFLYIAYLLYRTYKGKYRLYLSEIAKSWLQERLLVRSILIVLLIVSLGMFMQRDGYNIVVYHEIIPDCSKVLNIKSCSAYSPWHYDYVTHNRLLAKKPGSVTFYNPVSYMGVWLYWMWYRLFFAINGPTSGFRNYPPLPLPSAAAILIATGSCYAVYRSRRKLFFGKPYFLLLLTVSITYAAALWLDGYTEYHYTHILQAMNGRYLLPILIPVGAILGRAYSLTLKMKPTYKKVLAVMVVLFFIEGGGVLTFISRSDTTWYWHNTSVVKANQVAQKITKPVIVSGKKTYRTHLWFYN